MLMPICLDQLKMLQTEFGSLWLQVQQQLLSEELSKYVQRTKKFKGGFCVDNLVSKVAALGVPGLVLLVVTSISGFAGAAALTAGLSTLGGPLGMVGGIGVLGVVALITDGLSKYGFDRIFENVVKKLIEKGESKRTILEKIEKYPISKSLKLKLKDLL